MSELKIVANVIFEECIILLSRWKKDNIYLNPKLPCVVCKLFSILKIIWENNTFDLFAYLVQIYTYTSQKTMCTQQNKPECFEKWIFLYEDLWIIRMRTIITKQFI